MREEKSCNLLFVYGTLRKDSANELTRTLTQNASYLGEAYARGRLFDLGFYPGMVLSTTTGDSVAGELYEIAPDRRREVLNEIDKYEGCGPTDPMPHEYRRQIIEVFTPCATVKAWAYLLNRPTYGLERIPSGDYLKWRRSVKATR